MKTVSGVIDWWPSLAYEEMAPTVDYVHRLSQIGGKYTLDQPYEPYWANATLVITPRGFATRALRAGEVLFSVEYAILDGKVIVSASTGRAEIPIAAGSVAAFYMKFIEAVEPLGIPAPRTTIETEIPNPLKLDKDVAPRAYDASIAARMWAAFASAAGALDAWQSSYRGPHARAGIMWGGFDVYAPRYNGRSVVPPAGRPVFQQNGMNGEVVAVGFSPGDETSRAASFYAYISPPPPGIESADFGVANAGYNAAAGLAILPWESVRTSADPVATVVRFADAVYAAAVRLGGWPSDWVGARHDGWYATRNLIQ